MSEQFSVENLYEIDPDTVDWSEFDYPIESFLLRDGSWQYGKNFGEKDTTISEKDMLDCNQFEKVYYAIAGTPEGEDWTFLIKHKLGYYVYFVAGCDYTGFFGCQGGGGSITYGLDGKQMWLLGLTNDTRRNLGYKV
jgi:hypothetical protein